uniref:Uncharacterized protein n=1 Tax=Zonotrichia albicollis TaxID=44394 RepID=A0A8D2N2P2_ZONAL
MSMAAERLCASLGPCRTRGMLSQPRSPQPYYSMSQTGNTVASARFPLPPQIFFKFYICEGKRRDTKKWNNSGDMLLFAFPVSLRNSYSVISPVTKTGENKRLLIFASFTHNVLKIDFFFLLIDTLLVDSFTGVQGFGFISPEGLVQPKLSDPFQNRADWPKPVGTS